MIRTLHRPLAAYDARQHQVVARLEAERAHVELAAASAVQDHRARRAHRLAALLHAEAAAAHRRSAACCGLDRDWGWR